MPAYSGTIALVLGIIVNILTFAGVKLPDDFAGQATSATVAVISTVIMLIGIWRLLFGKKAVTTLNAQVVAQGIVPLAGPGKGEIPSEADKLNAQSLAEARARAAGVPVVRAVPDKG